ncbi:hypothetical protein LGQ03_16535 [Loktanella sp. TSTF-M6]|uniref:Helix-turn-helix domain-containing protein n=1 Tax=Loktanella gaetbuli TaxID=2881335 RepID=A0ABS8BYN3_9RHOB|nr:hypothetical protein [Loktanella gaetbuli]MCB5200846.1 hypothetical protein [Loktanella gaetbuli]
MGLSLRQAADQCGKSRSTIHRALKDGRLSGKQDDKGEWSIEGAELARVFPWDSRGHGEREATEQQRATPDMGEIMAVKVAMLEQQLEREQETVADLRKRLDRAEDRVTALTDQRVGAGASKGWLARIMGR